MTLPFLTSALGGCKRLASPPALFTPEIVTGTHCIGGWVVPRAGLDAVEESFCPARDPTPAAQPVTVAVPTELCRLNSSEGSGNAD
jgi:hypothetical protein